MTDCGYGNHTYRYCRRCKNPTSCSKCGEHPDKVYKQRIAELEAQEMGFVQSLCSQSEDIGRLKQRIEALEAVEKIALDLVNRDIKWREALHRFQTILLLGRGDGH